MNAKKRMLAAIMFTDIVGYTAVMQENEQHAANIRSRHRTVLKDRHQEYNGEVVQYYGDGTLSVFRSAVEAVSCAIDIQHDLCSGVQVPLRIGLHLGDIVFDDNEIYGDGVNLASRIESLGVPGSILISDKLGFAVKNHETIDTKSIGIFEFKNIKDPVEVFAVANEGIKIPARTELKGKLKEKKKSIAVLPFVNMSADRENEYFSDGITEEIINALTKVQGLHVTARTSAFSFKGKEMDVREISTQLNVSHILEGSVRKAGNRVRITAQLISGIDGYHLFSENYDRTLDDIFDVQDEIASTILNRLRQHLSEKEHDEKLVTATTTNMEAYETYLRGVFFHNQWGEESMVKAIPIFEKSIELDPEFGLPHARLTLCYLLGAFGGKVSWELAREKVKYHIQKLEESGAETPEKYFAKGVFEIFFNWNWEAALETTYRGLELFPNYASLYHLLSTMHYIAGNHDELVNTHKKGYQMDPMSIEMIFYMGIAYLWTGELDTALPFLKRVLELLPTHRTAWEYIGWIHAFQGDYKEALQIFDSLEPAMGYRLHQKTCQGWVYFKTGDIGKAEACLQFLHEWEKESIGATLDLATLYVGMQKFDEAIDYLEKAIRNRVGDTMMIRTDIFFKPIWDDPRFAEIKNLIGEVPPIRKI